MNRTRPATSTTHPPTTTHPTPTPSAEQAPKAPGDAGRGRSPRPLGKTADNSATAGQTGCGHNREDRRRETRRESYRVLRRLQLWTDLGRVARCRRVANNVTGGVVFRESETIEGRRWGVSGMQSCGSGACCPVCSRQISARRAAEIEAVLTEVGRAGGSVAMATLTMRHNVGQKLAMLWDGLSGAWNAVNSARAMRVEKEEHSIIGRIRAVESTHGLAGWHLHQHCLIAFDRPCSIERAEIVTEAWFDRWSRHLVRKGFDAPLMDRGGLDTRMIDLGEGTTVSAIAEYLAKASFEMAGGMSKVGRREGNRTPFEILTDAVEGVAEDVQLWWEWEKASFRRKMISWHDGIREWAGLRQEQTDEQIVEEDKGGNAVVAVKAEHTATVVRHLPAVLDLGEQYGVTAVTAWLDARDLGWFVPRPRPPGRLRNGPAPRLVEVPA